MAIKNEYNMSIIKSIHVLVSFSIIAYVSFFVFTSTFVASSSFSSYESYCWVLHPPKVIETCGLMSNFHIKNALCSMEFILNVISKMGHHLLWILRWDIAISLHLIFLVVVLGCCWDLAILNLFSWMWPTNSFDIQLNPNPTNSFNIQLNPKDHCP